MLSELELDQLYNCTETLFTNDAEVLNVSQLLDLLPITLKNNPILRESLGECLWPGEKRPYDPPWWARLAWSAAFATMLLVAIVGNIIVIWIVLAHRRMRTVTNCFLVNLAFADLLMAILNGAPNFVFLLSGHWPFGTVACTASNFAANLTVAASVFTLVAMSLDRYVAIVRPLRHRLSRRVARGAVVLIWVGGAVLALPCILYSATLTKRYKHGQWRQVCYMLWPDGRYPSSVTEYIYNVVFLGVTYVVPVAAMAGCYARMARALWGRAIGERTRRQLEAVRAKRKVVRMFLLVVGVFALCWLPYHAYYLVVFHHVTLASAPAIQHVYLAFYWLAMSNAMVNPLIYYWLNHKFRVYFQRALCCYCCNDNAPDVPDLIMKQSALQRTLSMNCPKEQRRGTTITRV